MKNFVLLLVIFLFSSFNPVYSQADNLETIEFQDATIIDIDTLIIHNSPMPDSGEWWIKINGERIRNKRKSIYLWNGNPRRRSAISGRVNDEGIWNWKQRPKSQGYAAFDMEVSGKIHIICRNGAEINRCYRITEIRTNSSGEIKYFKGIQISCD